MNCSAAKKISIWVAIFGWLISSAGVCFANTPGTLKWKYSLTYHYYGPVVAPDGTIYLTNGNLQALNPDGTLKWEFIPSGSLNPSLNASKPFVGPDGTIYYVLNQKKQTLTAVNPDGSLKWQYMLDQHTFFTVSKILTASIGNMQPTADSSGKVYLAVYDTLYCIYPDGTLNWTYQLNQGEIFESVPKVSPDGTVYFGKSETTNYPSYTLSAYTLCAVNPDGTEKWAYSTTGPVRSIVRIADDGTIYADASNLIFALYPDGTLKWEYSSGYPIDYIDYKDVAIGPDEKIYLVSATEQLGYDDDQHLKKYRPWYAVSPDGKDSFTCWGLESIGDYPILLADGFVYIPYGTRIIAVDQSLNKKAWGYDGEADDHFEHLAVGPDGTIYASDGFSYNVYAIYAYPKSVPGTPVLSVTTNGTTAEISWSADDADGYILYYTLSPAGSPMYEIDLGGQTSLSVTLLPEWSGDVYSVIVKAYNSTGSSDFSNLESFVIP